MVFSNTKKERTNYICITILHVLVPLASHKLDYMLSLFSYSYVSEQMKHVSYTYVFLWIESVSRMCDRQTKLGSKGRSSFCPSTWSLSFIFRGCTVDISITISFDMSLWLADGLTHAYSEAEALARTWLLGVVVVCHSLPRGSENSVQTPALVRRGLSGGHH